MLSLHKLFLPLFVALQLISNQVIADTATHIACTYAHSGRGLSEAINLELDRIQENAYNDNQFFEFISAEIDDYYMFVLYNLSDKNGETNPMKTKVAYGTGWSINGIHENLQEVLNFIQDSALIENKSMNFLDIQISQNGNAYIIYEISE